MKQNIRKFILSSNTFGGYTKEINLNYCDTISDIIDNITKSLNDMLNINNLDCLIELLKASKFHIHDFTFEDILISPKSQVFYICDHCE